MSSGARVDRWRWLNDWRLFWLLSLADTVAVGCGLPWVDYRSAKGLEFMIKHSVRCSLPLFLMAFTASPLARIRRSDFSRWLVRNRRYIGLAFAYAMFIHFAWVGYSTYHFGNGLNRFVTSLDLIGALFLSAMTVTSSDFAIRLMGPSNWRRLHKAGIYAIWALFTYIYLSAVRYERELHDILIAALLLIAWALRVFAKPAGRGPRVVGRTASP